MLKKINLKKTILVFIVVVVLFFLYLLYSVYNFYNIVYEPLETKEVTEETDKASRSDQSIKNILLLGIDNDGESYKGGRPDVIMLARLNRDNNNIGIVSIPRDTRVELPGRGYDKINHAYAYEGSGYLVQTLEGFLDIDIHNYAKINFDGFVNIVDAIGGVEMDIEQDMYYYDDALDEVIVDLEEGKQALDGEEALGFVRWRGTPDADIGRIQRQQKFLQNMLDQTISFGNIIKSRQISNKFANNIKTNFQLADTLLLSWSAFRADWNEVSTKTLEGEGVRIDGIWYYNVDQERARGTIDEVI